MSNKYNEAIIALSNKYNILYIVQADDKFFNSSFYLKNMVNGHHLAVVYSGMAKAFKRMIETYMIDSFDYFRDYKY